MKSINKDVIEAELLKRADVRVDRPKSFDILDYMGIEEDD